MAMYQEAYDKLCAEISILEEALKETLQGYKKQKERLTVEEENTYITSINEYERNLKALHFRKFHMEDQMYNYISGMNGNGNNPKIEECWVFDWTFDPFQFSVELSEEEIKQKAVNELRAKGNAMRHALSACKVKSRRLNTWELIDLCRRHSSPLSAERYKLKDVINSSFFEDIQTSVSLEEMEKYAKEVMSQEIKNQFLNQTSLNDKAIEELAEIMRESDEAAARADNQFKLEKTNSEEGRRKDTELCFEI